MPCIISVSFYHQCGHTSTEITHSSGCPTFTPYTTPILGCLLNAVLPRTCITFETNHVYLNTQCAACTSSGMSTSVPGSHSQVFSIPELIRHRKEYKKRVNQQQDFERRHREAVAYGDQAETQWLLDRESERLLQEQSGILLKDQTLVYHPRKNKGDKFLQKSTLEAGAFCASLLNAISPVKCRSTKVVYAYIYRKCCACESTNTSPKYSLDDLVHRRTKYRALWDAQQYSEETRRQARPFGDSQNQEVLEKYKVKMAGELEADILIRKKLNSRVENWLQDSEVSELEKDKVVDGEIDEFEELFGLLSGST
ncbi:hypothetical protein BDZ45DRAFT_737513 [Acephala macrosclerotiorum]|nr:hypothetical protein BDZ45DRAFT_737513 [Acephala macrosclerotiorum]